MRSRLDEACLVRAHLQLEAEGAGVDFLRDQREEGRTVFFHECLAVLGVFGGQDVAHLLQEVLHFTLRHTTVSTVSAEIGIHNIYPTVGFTLARSLGKAIDALKVLILI